MTPCFSLGKCIMLPRANTNNAQMWTLLRTSMLSPTKKTPPHEVLYLHKSYRFYALLPLEKQQHIEWCILRQDEFSKST